MAKILFFYIYSSRTHGVAHFNYHVKMQGKLCVLWIMGAHQDSGGRDETLKELSWGSSQTVDSQQSCEQYNNYV